MIFLALTAVAVILQDPPLSSGETAVSAPGGYDFSHYADRVARRAYGIDSSYSDYQSLWKICSTCFDAFVLTVTAAPPGDDRRPPFSGDLGDLVRGTLLKHSQDDDPSFGFKN